MRTSVFLLFCVLSAGVFAADYPYQASILVPETPVLSGPGSEYYITSVLQRGDKVEVYYETEDWCAIRPPVGSFSWISAVYVELETNGIGTVVADGLASRVGSEDTELCDTVQVKLKQGEKVLVVGRRETPENAASPLWYKIAPPSGEFRWIPRSALFSKATRTDRNIAQVVYETEVPSTAPVVVPSAVPSLPMTPRPSPQTPRRTPPVEMTTDASKDGMIDLLTLPEPPKTAATESSTVNDVLRIPLAEKLASARPGQARIDVPVKEVDPLRAEFDRAFEELKEETRAVLTRPTEDWVFQTLIDRGDELYKVAPSDADMEKIYHVVETLQRTWAVRKEIAYRRQFRTGGLLTPPPSATPSPAASSVTASAATVSPVYGRNNGAPAPQPTAPAVPVAENPVSRGREAAPAIPSANKAQYGFKLLGYDVVGRLGEFENPPTKHPPYAVADENERILCLISPAVGVELKEHVGKLVGINGVLGFYEKANQPKRRHIMVQEIDVLDFK